LTPEAPKQRKLHLGVIHQNKGNVRYHWEKKWCSLHKDYYTKFTFRRKALQRNTLKVS